MELNTLLLAESEWIGIGMLITTVALTVVTVVYVRLTHQLVRAQTDPCVIAYTRETEKFKNGVRFVELVIENVGEAVARDVRIGPIR